MNEADYRDALTLLDRATRLLHTSQVSSQADLVYELRRLRMALDILRMQIGQAPPELQRN